MMVFSVPVVAAHAEDGSHGSGGPGPAKVTTEPEAGIRASAVREYRLRLRADGDKFCMSTSNGKAVLKKCSSSSKYQRWQIGKINGYPVWINVGHPGKALTVNSFSPGAPLLLKSAVGNGKQSFQYADLDQIVYATSSPTLVLAAGDAKSGSAVRLEQDLDVGRQKWALLVVQ
ncbi:hypothetical protein GCM10027456_55630 [Kineosporia babensis]